MGVPAQALEVIARFEGLHKQRKDGLIEAYICPAGYPTIGYGRLLKSLDHPPITKEAATEYLAEDAGVAMSGALRASAALAMAGDARLSAIVSFAFNLGVGAYHASTLRRRVNEGDWAGAAREIRRWVNAGGRKLPGLVLRREIEALMLERGS